MAGTFMFVMLDLDVPPGNGSTKRRVLLHDMTTGFKAAKGKANGTTTLLQSTEKGPAPYISPNPPATDTMAHRYVELLFMQPDKLQVPASTFANMTARINFDINAFMKQHSLSAPVAANFFQVDGKAGPKGTGGMASPTGGKGGKPTPQPFEGAGSELSVPLRMAVQLGGLAVFVLFAL